MGCRSWGENNLDKENVEQGEVRAQIGEKQLQIQDEIDLDSIENMEQGGVRVHLGKKKQCNEDEFDLDFVKTASDKVAASWRKQIVRIENVDPKEHFDDFLSTISHFPEPINKMAQKNSKKSSRINNIFIY